MGITEPVWSDERVVELKRLWSAGGTCSEIASRLGNGISRNAVIGKIARLGLTGRVKTNAGPAKQKIERTISVRRARPATGGLEAFNAVRRVERLARSPGLPEEIVSHVADGSGVSLFDLDTTNCHWPKGDPLQSTFEFCGAGAVDGQPYCAAHCRLAYDRQPRRNRTVDELNSKLSHAHANNFYQR